MAKAHTHYPAPAIGATLKNALHGNCVVCKEKIIWAEGDLEWIIPSPLQEEYKFRYFLHDNYEAGEMAEHLQDPRFGGMPESVAQEICDRRPFYEVTFYCTYNTTTKKLTMVLDKPDGWV